MFRDGKYIAYNSKGYGGRHDKNFFRNDKSEFYTKDCLDIKKEIIKLKNSIFVLESKIKREKTIDTSSLKTLEQLKFDLSFWLKEMDKFDNLPSHKKLKTKRKKIKYSVLKEKVLEIINEGIKNNSYFVTKEDIAFKLQINKKDLDKLFMELNREGILSQPKHELMHDSSRGFLPLTTYESGDWAADIYYIRIKEEN